MAKVLDSKSFGDILYKTFPESYRTDDIATGYALKRYLQALADGGFSEVIEETNNVLTLVDPEKINADLLPILFKNYGMEIFNGVPELFLRKLLPVVSDLYARKGCITSVEYLTSIISGVKSSVEVSDDFNNDHAIDVKLEMDYGLENNELPDRDQLLRIIQEFVPFFCNVTIVYAYKFIEYFMIFMDDSKAYDKIKDKVTDTTKIVIREDFKERYKNPLKEDNAIPKQKDYNSLIGDMNYSVIGSTMILNNASSYDVITTSTGTIKIFT